MVSNEGAPLSLIPKSKLGLTEYSTPQTTSPLMSLVLSLYLWVWLGLCQLWVIVLKYPTGAHQGKFFIGQDYLEGHGIKIPSDRASGVTK